MKKINGIIMQYFEWYLNCEKGLWNKVIEECRKIIKMLELLLYGYLQHIKELVEKMTVGYGAI